MAKLFYGMRTLQWVESDCDGQDNSRPISEANNEQQASRSHDRYVMIRALHSPHIPCYQTATTYLIYYTSHNFSYLDNISHQYPENIEVSQVSILLGEFLNY